MKRRIPARDLHMKVFSAENLPDLFGITRTRETEEEKRFKDNIRKAIAVKYGKEWLMTDLFEISFKYVFRLPTDNLWILNIHKKAPVMVRLMAIHGGNAYMVYAALESEEDGGALRDVMVFEAEVVLELKHARRELKRSEPD